MLALLVGCGPMFRATKVPVASKIYGDIATAEMVYVMLPGYGDDHLAFEYRGFLAVAKKHLGDGNSAAFVAVDAHIGYYREQEIAERMRQDVLENLKGKKVTLIGMSLGGFGALMTARRNTKRFHRILLFAPFLGWKNDISALRKNFSVNTGSAQSKEVFAIWRWIAGGGDGTPISILYGRRDSRIGDYEFLISRAAQVKLEGQDGGHNWRTWNRLWQTWLSNKPGQ